MNAVQTLSKDPLTMRSKIFGMFLQKQTYLNLVYLAVSIGMGFGYYLILQIFLALSWGLIFPNVEILASLSLDLLAGLKVAAVVLSGVLIIPLLVPILQLTVPFEQALANWLLDAYIPVDMSLWSRSSILLKPRRLFRSAAAWKRLLFVLLRIPLGATSFYALFTVLLPAIAMLGMPLAYGVGFRNLILGPWRIDSLEKAGLAFLAGVVLVPLAFYGLNLLGYLSVWLARTLLPATRE